MGIKNVKMNINAGTSAEFKPTLLNFPTKWDTRLANFLTEPDFDKILTELGRLAAADSNLEQEMFDALSYLIDKNDFGSSVKYVAAELKNSFDKRKALLLVLHKAKEQDPARRADLEKILNDAKQWHDERNQSVHARWCIPNKPNGGVVRIKFDSTLGRDKSEPITQTDLNTISISMEACTERLRRFFLVFADYQQWLMKRMPPP